MAEMACLESLAWMGCLGGTGWTECQALMGCLGYLGSGGIKEDLARMAPPAGLDEKEKGVDLEGEDWMDQGGGLVRV